MKPTHILFGLVMLCGVACSVCAQTITTTPTNGPTMISIHARTTDGKLPVDVNCKVAEPLPQVFTFSTPKPLCLIGKSGDWTATNVPPETYEVVLRGSNYAKNIHSVVQFLRVEAGKSYCINFELSRGATFKGRILDDVTSKPIADAFVNGWSEYDDSCHVRSDAEGRYELPHIASALRIEVQMSNYVSQIVSVEAAAEDSTVSVPDIRLQHGGRISGWIEHPTDLESNAYATVLLEFQGDLPPNAAIETVYARADGTFRTYPVPPGTYTLHAEWQRRFGKGGGPRQTWEAKGTLKNVPVMAGQETTNVHIQTKLTVQESNQGGR
jgi:hypothetical protein